MLITELEVRCCRADTNSLGVDSMRAGGANGALEFLVLTMKTDAGTNASSFGFAGRSARGAGELTAAGLRPLFVGRNAFDREALWKEFRTADRWWNHLPIYSYGPADICLWLLGALAAGQPLYKYIGAARDSVPTYCSSLVLPGADDYAREAVAVKAAGHKAYKIHPPGKDIVQDIQIHHAVREAVGAGFDLMSDPVASYTLDEAIRLGRRLEQLDYRWIEEPIADENFSALRELTRILDIPVVGTEVLAKHPYSVAECIATRVVDVVRADVSWTGGITGVLKTAHLAESFHMNCELHTCILHPLELVNLHLCGSLANNTYFETLWPHDKFDFGLKQPLPIENGIARLPQGPGLGIDFDWDFIDRATYAIV
jgi:L-alanine-DL-glutamate epimerase-like enolase superfamily enzyme